jgi:hypothetical protein
VIFGNPDLLLPHLNRSMMRVNRNLCAPQGNIRAAIKQAVPSPGAKINSGTRWPSQAFRSHWIEAHLISFL